jgi:TetR/AcrR family transcriptional regulator, cholesterol catabolism regulator
VLPNQVKAKTVPIWRREDRADHIYRVAAEVMCQKGYAATSMNDIADAVGLTKAGIYHYIQGKEPLLFEIMTYAMDMIDQHVMDPARQVEDAEQRLRTIVERHAQRIIDVGGAVTILLEEMPALTPAHRRTIRGRKRAYFELMRETLQQLAGEGKLRDIDASVAALSLFGMINWISRWYRPAGKLSARETLDDILEMAICGVLK